MSPNADRQALDDGEALPSWGMRSESCGRLRAPRRAQALTAGESRSTMGLTLEKGTAVGAFEGPAAGATVCPECGADTDAGERFCTRCGHPLTASLDQATLPSPNTASEDVGGARKPVHRRGSLALIAAGVIALAAVGGMTAAWLLERSAHQRDQRAAHTQISALEQRLAGERARLVRSQALSARQAALLAEAGNVLGKVDPLLSKADRLQQLTGGIESSRDQFSADTSQLVNDMIDLGNNLVDAANIYGIDVSYLSNEIDAVNAEINTVRGEASSLSASDVGYSNASQSFGATATQFTDAVRALQRQLKLIPSGKP